MQHTYSYLGSPLHLVLEDKIAEGYNRFHDAFLEGQKHFAKTTGQEWTGVEALWMEVNQEDKDAYHAVAKLINLLIEINGGGLDIPEEQCTSDHLIRV
jgi:hypothetical protein